MPLFRKKPVVIEAVQFDGQNDPCKPHIFADTYEMVETPRKK